MVMLKGSGIGEITRHFGVMLIFALIINTLAVWNYRKTV
jgi:ABC-2 type transport system permease protein